jgi:hypothetical protein
MSAHTPGPWEVASNSSVVFAVNDDRDEDGCREAVAQCGSEIGPSRGLKFGLERDANARLIAAAPELLDALHRIAYGLECDGRTADGMTKAAAAKLARAAIAKAEDQS